MPGIFVLHHPEQFIVFSWRRLQPAWHRLHYGSWWLASIA
jgi:hypothetical protein